MSSELEAPAVAPRTEAGVGLQGLEGPALSEVEVTSTVSGPPCGWTSHGCWCLCGVGPSTPPSFSSCRSEGLSCTRQNRRGLPASCSVKGLPSTNEEGRSVPRQFLLCSGRVVCKRALVS